jgi:type I restriction enzyme R subunit
MRYYFAAYLTDANVRRIIDEGSVADLNVNPVFSMADLKAVPKEWVRGIPEYVKDYVSLNPFLP